MRKTGYLVALLVAILPSVAAADSNCPQWQQPLKTQAAVVEQINRLGFQNFQPITVNDALVPWYPMMSPVTDWYLCLAVSLGTPESAAVRQQQGIQAFTNAMERAHRRLTGAAWIDRSHTKVTPDVVDSLHTLSAAQIIPIDAVPLSYSDREFQPVSAWVEQEFPQVPDPRGFTTDLGRLSLGGDARLVLAFVYGISGEARFDVSLDRWPNDVTLPFFENEDIQAVRLDSSKARVSLYIFRGDDRAVRRLKSTMDYNAWQSIRNKFGLQKLHINRPRVAIDSRRSFLTMYDYNAYGVRMRTPQDSYSAQDQAHISLTEEGLSFAAISGEEGMVDVPFEIRDRFSYPNARPFSTTAPMFFVLEDMDTKVILMLGISALDKGTIE